MTGPADPDPGGVLRNFGCAKQYAKHCNTSRFSKSSSQTTFRPRGTQLKTEFTINVTEQDYQLRFRAFLEG